MRRMFVSRSSLENPKPLDRFSRTTSPSRISTGTPDSSNVSSTWCAIVVLPEPDKPVNQMTAPLSRFVCFMQPPFCWSESALFCISVSREGLLPQDRCAERPGRRLETEQVQNRGVHVPQVQIILAA